MKLNKKELTKIKNIKENIFIFSKEIENFNIKFYINHIIENELYLKIEIGNIEKELNFKSNNDLINYLNSFNKYEIDKILYL